MKKSLLAILLLVCSEVFAQLRPVDISRLITQISHRRSTSVQSYPLMQIWYYVGSPSDASIESRYGIHRSAITYQSSFGDPDSTSASQAAATALGTSPYGNVALMDYEVPIVGPDRRESGGDAQMQADRAVLFNIARWYRSGAPSLKVGFFEMVPLADPCGLAKLFTGRRITTNADTLTAWRRANDSLKVLADSVDFLAPSVYAIWSDTSEIRQYIWMMMQECRRIAPTKKVYPIVSPQASINVGDLSVGYPLSYNTFRFILNIVSDTDPDSIFVWGSTNEASNAWNWDSTAGWWRALKEYATKTTQPDYTTAPVVATGTADTITSAQISFHGTVSWGGETSTPYVLYGKTWGGPYDSAKCSPALVDAKNVAIYKTVTGLDFNTDYYYCFGVSNAKGYTRSTPDTAKTSGATYALQDEFTFNIAAGSLNATKATDSVNTRTVTDTGGDKISTTGGNCVINGGSGSFGNPGLWYNNMTRQAGKMMVSLFNGTSFTGIGYVGWDAGQAGQSTGPTFTWTNNANVQAGGTLGNAYASSTTLSTSTNYLFCTIARTAGGFYFMKGGSMTYWTLLDWVGAGTEATLNASYSATAGNYSLGWVHVPTNRWLPPPTASDGFTTTFGTTDGKGTAEGVNDSTGKGGSGVTWTSQLGTQTVVSAGAYAATTSGGQSIATVPCSTPNNLVEVQYTRGVASHRAGLVYRWASATNYVYTVCDSGSGRIVTIKVVNGNQSTVDSTAYTYSAGKGLRIDINGSTVKVSYNNAAIKTLTISDASLGNNVGVYWDELASRLDNFVVFAKGTSNEYSYLDNFGALP